MLPGSALRLNAHLLALALAIWAAAAAAARETAKPVWLVSNGFHTSLAVRAKDLPEARNIAGDARADLVLIGWGAGDWYRGRTNAWTLVKAICGIGPSILHVVPVRGAITGRFPRSDVVELRLAPAEMRRLAARLDRSFSRGQAGRRILVGRGYYPESRFYIGRDRFYFPKMCNFWVAQALRDSGVRVCVPTAITADNLTRQVERSGRRQQRRSKPVDAF
jgi:uncharacterized protein (TIGR02117 family)